MSDVKSLRAGDRIIGEREMTVTQTTGRSVYLTDVVSGQDFTIPIDSDQGSWDFWVVEKAKREYGVGDVITGAELQDKMWKRGTVVTEGGHAFLLLASGVWQTTDQLGDTEIFFSDFAPDEKLTITHIPTEQ